MLLDYYLNVGNLSGHKQNKHSGATRSVCGPTIAARRTRRVLVSLRGKKKTAVSEPRFSGALQEEEVSWKTRKGSSKGCFRNRKYASCRREAEADVTSEQRGP